MNIPENLRMAISMLLIVMVGVAYYALTEIIDRDFVPMLVDQGAYVFSAEDPSLALGRWNLFSYLFSIVASGIICAIAVIIFSRYGLWLETLPAVITAVAFYGIAFSRQYYHLYPLSYDVIKVLAFIVVLPVCFISLQSLLKRLNRSGDA